MMELTKEYEVAQASSMRLMKSGKPFRSLKNCPCMEDMKK